MTVYQENLKLKGELNQNVDDERFVYIYIFFFFFFFFFFF